MNKAFFLDRDGVINAEVDYLFEPDKVVILPGVVPALKRMREHGFLRGARHVCGRGRACGA